jgi:SAM-dependent methyltransferase
MKELFMALPRLLKPLERPQQGNIKQDLSLWFESELGLALLEKQKQLLEGILPKLFGYHLIYSGFNQLEPVVESSPIKHKVFLDLNSTKSQLTSNIHQLPILSDSADLVILQHSLDFEKDPFQVLREATRIVLPNGNLVVIGFNPWSLWGLWRTILFRSSRAPWNLRFISPYRLSEWLDILGFDIAGCESAYYMPPFTKFSKENSLTWLERLGNTWLTQRGGFYLLVAKKRVSCITPLRLQERRIRRNIIPISVAGKVNSSSQKRPFSDD